MSIEVRVLLFIGSLLTFLFIVREIKKRNIKFDDMIFWTLFSFCLILISVFPEIIYEVSKLLQFQSPINLVYLLVIFLLIANQFNMQCKISKLNIRQKKIIQDNALNEKKKEKKTL